MPSLRVHLLGPVTADADGSPVAVGGPRARVLLAVLALNAGRVVTAERLVDALYGGEALAGSANALQSQVSRLRKAIGDTDGTGLLQFLPGGYRLAIDPDDVDAHRFARLAAEGARALSTADHAYAAEVLARAESLWRGPAFADLDAPFARAQAVRLEETRLSAVEDRVEAALHLGEPRPLIAELRGLVAAHPLRERLYGQLMRALQADGRQAEALRVYEQARQAIGDALGADPSPELAAVHLAVLRGTGSAPAPSPVAGSAAVKARRPPAQLTSFVGRERDLERVAELVASSRLTTLTGPGGAGKTRLAIEASHAAADVCFVDLSGVETGGDVAYAVFGALGLREGGGMHKVAREDVPERVEAVLSGRSALLILDNCEHVVGPAARFADGLLRACPRVRILATSREALGITGEALYPVPPLAAPPADADPQGTDAYPAMRLFAERARAARHDFAVDAGNVHAVATICRSLDGLPLAIELAAARLRSLSVADIAAHLHDRFRLLSKGSRTAQPRHQTLRAVVSWSWDLLDREERDAARRLSVFAGGFTLEAAAAVCGLSDADAVDLLTGLADKSLLEADGGRYRMLGTIRGFCADRLSEKDGSHRVYRAHARYFHGLLAEAEPHLRSHAQLEWLERLAAEHDNLHAAMRWATLNDTALALSVNAFLVPYWWLRGLRTEGAALAGSLVARLDAAAPPGLGEEYVLAVLSAAADEPDKPGLIPHMLAVREIGAGLAFPFRHPYLMILWAIYAGAPDAEPGGYDALAETMRDLGDPWTLAMTHLGSAFYYWHIIGDAERTLHAAAEGLARFRTVGDRWGMITALQLLASWTDPDTERHVAEAIALAEELGSAEDHANLLCQRGQARAAAGEYEAARTDFAHAGELARRAGCPEQIALSDHGLAQLALRGGDLDTARRLAAVALSECPTGWLQVNQTYPLVNTLLGWIADAAGDPEDAARHHREAMASSLRLRQHALTAAAVTGLASATRANGDPVRAAWLLGAAESLHAPTLEVDADARAAAVRLRELLDAEECRAAYDEARSMRRGALVAALSGWG